MKEEDILETDYFNFEGAKVQLIKSKDDPICLRVSAGGDEREGYYCNYRGDIKRIKFVLERCLQSINMKINKDETDISIN